MSSCPRAVPVASLYRRMDDLEGQVFDLAQTFALERGAREGFGVDDWFRAEAAIRGNLTVLCERKPGAFAIRIDLPGVSPENVDLGLERDELVVGVRGPKPAFCALGLPADLDAARAVASLASGMLTVVLPERRDAWVPGSVKRPA